MNQWLCARCLITPYYEDTRDGIADTIVDGTALCIRHAREILSAQVTQ